MVMTIRHTNATANIIESTEITIDATAYFFDEAESRDAATVSFISAALSKLLNLRSDTAASIMPIMFMASALMIKAATGSELFTSFFVLPDKDTVSLTFSSSVSFSPQ